MTQKARYIMIGGFLGAGKSTSLLKLAEHLTNQGLKVGLITNDQGHSLVDTMKVANHGFPVQEIPGGCFCCRFNTLMEAADALTQETRPDVFLAEPVGSCTDLIASVSYPLRRIYGDRFEISPLSVLVDPLRAMAILGLSNKRRFSKKVAYIYLKQLEEASVIVINKTDLLEPQQLDDLQAALEERFPKARVLRCAVRENKGLDEWFHIIEGEEQAPGATMEVDYKVYAEGEALLGWLNATVEFNAGKLLDGDTVLKTLADNVRKRLNEISVEIAHFKMTLEPDDGSGELAVINLVGSDYQPEFSQSLSDPLQRGQLILNLRAEGSPESLAATLQQALTTTCLRHGDLNLHLEHMEHFRPGEPKPVYRMADADDEAVALV